MRWEKIKIQKRWLLGRLSECSLFLSFFSVSLFLSFVLCSFFRLAGNGLGLGVRAGFSARKVRASDKAQIYEKCRTGTSAPPDVKPLLSVRPTFLYVVCPFILLCRGALAGGSFVFFVWLCVLAKMQMFHQKRWLFHYEIYNYSDDDYSNCYK